MSLWSKIARIGGYAAAPFTGGASIGIGNGIAGVLDTVGSGAGKAAGGMAHNRGVKADQLLEQNRDLESQLLARESEKRQARTSAYRDAMVGQNAMNFRPATRPSTIRTPSYTTGTSEGGQQAASELFNQAMARMQQPDLTTPGGMPAYRNLAEDKEYQGTMKPGFWEKLAGIGAFAAPILGQLAGRGGDTYNETRGGETTQVRGSRAGRQQSSRPSFSMPESSGISGPIPGMQIFSPGGSVPGANVELRHRLFGKDGIDANTLPGSF